MAANFLAEEKKRTRTQLTSSLNSFIYDRRRGKVRPLGKPDTKIRDADVCEQMAKCIGVSKYMLTGIRGQWREIS